ncbi:hypothetical protein [Embleya sp. NBC_00896]|uniref:hypothetical protein n=1 Tax=Embleya sp. NBC_00896 TaxID=2975961 RepID=UPI0038693787|nr:N-terminal phage integrase SAM-like domain-containing protein [Embleya sp. NBC_00896]
MAEYPTEWLEARALDLKPTTLVRYRDYVVNDLVPHPGGIRLDELGRRAWSVSLGRNSRAGAAG